MKKSTVILAGILVVLIAATFLVLQRPGELSVSGSQGGLLASYDSSQVDRIEVHSASGTTVLHRENGAWMMTSPLRAKADDAGVRELLSKGKSITLKAMVSGNPQKQGVFQVDSSGTLVRLFAGDAERAAFRIGKMGPTYTETYVRREDANEVYLAEGMLLYVFAKQPRDWRDKTILKVPQESIRNVRFQYGDSTFALTFRDSMWTVDGVPASEPAVKSLLGGLASLTADDFVDSTLSSPPPLTALIDADGTQIRFHRDIEKNSYHVVTSSGSQVFEMQGWHADQVLKRKRDLLKTQP
jgi:hypothetical protein